MKTNYIRQFILFSVALPVLILTSCGSQTDVIQPTPSEPLPIVSTNTPTPSQTGTITPTPTFTATATTCLGLAATPVHTPMPWYGSSWDKLAISRIPIQGMECAAPEEIVRQLMLQWLEKLKTNSKGQECSLNDYTIDTIVMMTNISQYELLAWVGYRLKPGSHVNCAWMTTHLDKIEPDGWITTFAVFGVYRENGNFRLVILPGWGV